MQVLACQFDMVWEDKAANFPRASALIDAADPPPGSLLVLPEMFATGFSMHADKIAEPVGGPTHAYLSGLAGKRRCHVMAGMATRAADGRARNEAFIFDPTGREAARYCKRHPFTLGGEAKNYVAGDDFVVLPIGPLLASPSICYDLRFPESYREAARRGAQLLLVIASWPAVRVGHWRALLVARAIENQAYVVGVNRVGRDPHLGYSGQSLIVDQSGRILADAEDGERVIRAELELEPLVAYRRELPFLADIRLDDFPAGPPAGK